MDLFDVAAKISLDTKGYERGLDDASSKTHTFAETLGSGLKTAAKVGAAALTAAATAATALGTAAVKAYADYEQLVGGAKLMFGEAYDFIANKAQNAFATVQMSQNDYLRQVNGFATGLKTALGGNEKAAAQLADRIITAEADIVAATGASQEAIQNAFNGIMKSNYTMLDNLQIGIKPTKEGFQEVIDKVNEWNEANGRATNYQIDNLADAQAALVDYIEMVGMAGYANREASDTIQGSMAAAKAAWNNLLTGLADDEADLENLVDNVVVTVSKAGENIMPRVETVLDGIGKLIDTLLPKIVEKIPKLINKYLPKLIKSGAKIIASLISGITGDSDALISTAQEAIRLIVDTITKSLPKLVKVGGNIITEFIVGLSEMLPEIADAAIEMIQLLLETLTDTSNLSTILDAVLTIIVKVAEKIIDALPTIIEAVMQVIEALVDFLTGDALPSIIEAGITLFTALIDALPEIIATIVEALPEIIDGILDAITENLPLIIDGGIQLFTALIGELPQIIEVIAGALPEIIDGILDAITENLQLIIDGGIQLFTALIDELPQIIETIAEALPEIIDGILGAIIENLPTIVAAGMLLFTSLIARMPRITEIITGEIPDLVGSIVSEIVANLPSIVEAGVMIAGSLLEGIWDGLFGDEGLFVQLYDALFGGTDELLIALGEGLFGGGSSSGADRGAGRGAGFGGGIPEIPKRGAGFGGNDGFVGGGGSARPGAGLSRPNPKAKPRAGFGRGMSTEGYEGNTGGVHITQNIYSQAMSAADIMEEALFRQREAILFGV